MARRVRGEWRRRLGKNRSRFRVVLRAVWRFVKSRWEEVAYLCYSVPKRTFAWLSRRCRAINFRHFLVGLPALSVLIGGAVLVEMMGTRSKAELIQEYKRVAWDALETGNLPEAGVAFQRLSRLEDPPLEGRFGLGLLAEREGNKERSLALILPLAPRDHAGLPAAHVWRARQLLNGSPSPAALIEAEAHLIRALEKSPNHSLAQTLLARVYLETNRLEQAEPLVAVHGPANPELMLHLVRLYQLRGDTARAAREADRAAAGLAEQVKSRPAEPTLRLRWADALVLQGKFADAVHVLREGAALFPQEGFALPLSRVALQWSKALGNAPVPGGVNPQQVLKQSIGLMETLPDSSEKHIQLYRLFAALGDLQQAERYLVRATAQTPELRVELARLYVQRGMSGKATETARAALEEYRAQLRLNPANGSARFLAADAALVLRDYPTSAALLREGLEATRSRPYATALASVYVHWFDDTDVPMSGPDDRLDLLRQSLLADPWNVDALRRLLVAGRGDAAQSAKARAMIEAMLVQGEVPALAHFYLGTDFLEQGKLAEAQAHLEQAYRADPQLTDAANNLAWALAHADPPDLPRALQIIELAVRRRPQYVPLRHTHGVILFKMGQWKESLTELEFCLPTMPNHTGLHRMLADVYSRLDQPELAEKHRRLAGGMP